MECDIKAWHPKSQMTREKNKKTVAVEVAGTNPEPCSSKSIRTYPMKGGARRKLLISDPPPPPPQPSRRFRNEINDQVNDHDNQMPEQKQQQPPPINDAEKGGNECDLEEDEANEEDDQSGDVDVPGEEGDVGETENNGDEERPKLAEGFYEIEAVRRRRTRKGEKQYLIKWKGWPESANTWEPVENLMACVDVIDAFEESLKSGKHRSKRKRKHKNAVASTTQPKKKQQQQQQQPNQDSPDATYPIPSTRIRILEEPCEGHCIHQPNFSNMADNNVEGTSRNGTTNQYNDTGYLMGSPNIRENKDSNELVVNHSDLRATSSSNQENLTAEFAIHIQEDQAAEGVVPVEVGPENGVSKVVETEVLRVSPRIGARRRKSCAVKRFKQESNLGSKKDVTEKLTAASDEIVQADIQNAGDVETGVDSKSTIDAPQNVSAITKIIKPVNYKTSILNGTEEVCVSFLVKRSDGADVVVDNKYLKENNPILLINFYEQHLRYTSPE